MALPPVGQLLKSPSSHPTNSSATLHSTPTSSAYRVPLNLSPAHLSRLHNEQNHELHQQQQPQHLSLSVTHPPGHDLNDTVTASLDKARAHSNENTNAAPLVCISGPLGSCGGLLASGVRTDEEKDRQRSLQLRLFFKSCYQNSRDCGSASPRSSPATLQLQSIHDSTAAFYVFKINDGFTVPQLGSTLANAKENALTVISTINHLDGSI
ncbi:hypothetical protein BIW11_02697 [Tropilaelaps mercedesae]|uniref:Uncharacterized protein n=1 Tax=Tropilaelaps mercedesae TaxID=418985 RepID=A0A1V9XYU1_9ACAR|nr:hypothetical protein BIW11_02697 [Tropilaelaps mercedesae]